MPKNNTSSDYWRGYRAARIYALFTAIEDYDLTRGDFEITSSESEAYLTGLHAGVNALRAELSKLIAHERALEKKG